jgi:hypothetical protein
MSRVDGCEHGSVGTTIGLAGVTERGTANGEPDRLDVRELDHVREGWGTVTSRHVSRSSLGLLPIRVGLRASALARARPTQGRG